MFYTFFSIKFKLFKLNILLYGNHILKVLNYDLTFVTIDNFFSSTYPLLQVYYGQNLKLGKSQKWPNKTLGAHNGCSDKI